jgi:hypothetical protein
LDTFAGGEFAQGLLVQNGWAKAMLRLSRKIEEHDARSPKLAPRLESQAVDDQMKKPEQWRH